MIIRVAALLVVVAAIVVGGAQGKGVTLTLERSSHAGLELSQLKDRDRVRHGRLLQQQPRGVVDFPVEGTYDPFVVGLYYTKVQLGTPPQEFYVQIDTGSDVLWVSCNSCTGCPTSTGLEIQLDFFDPSSSSTASRISCSDQRCVLGSQSFDSSCTNQNQCEYRFQYGDGSGTSGYYVSDSMHFNSVIGNSVTSINSSDIVFGCSTSQTGDLRKSDRAVDGIFGFGQQGLSVISQLYAHGITPNVFSHCLRGGTDGGGILVLGQIVEPNIVYTPLVPSQPHYNVNLQSIALNGQILSISPSVFATSNNQGTIIDSGTTLAYLAENAYDSLIAAITEIVSQSVHSVVVRGNQCYITSSSVSEIFPTVTFNFAGGASMILRPQDYLLQQNGIGGAREWCIGFQKIQGSAMTILGDLVLKDKIVVYDLAGQRIGWVNYDCSASVNVSTSGSGHTEFVNAGQIDNNSSPSQKPYKLITSIVIALFGILPFL